VLFQFMTRLAWLSLLGFVFVLSSEGAENAILENARLHPGDFSANHAAGEYLVANKNLRSAIPYFEKAWQIDSANYVNGYDLALAYFETGSKQKSREIVQSLIRRQDKADLHNLLGDIEESEGRVNQAARQYELAARMDPSEKNLFDLGSDLLKHRSFSPALKVFQFGVERYAASAELRVGLGIAFYSLGQYDQAVQTLCQAVDADPKDTRALDFLGKMYDISPQYAEQVTRRLAHFASIYPDNSAANYYYALSLRKRSLNAAAETEQREAETYLVKAAKLNPEFADAHYELGLLYEDEKRDQDAIRQYELAVACQSGLAKAHYRLGRLYQKSGRELLAQKEFETMKALKDSR
jgi:tetratricopeptide (TPR) repeat protein